MLDGQAPVVDFGDVVVKRGTSYPLEYTFTATEATTVAIEAWICRSTIGFSGRMGGSGRLLVTFE